MNPNTNTNLGPDPLGQKTDPVSIIPFLPFHASHEQSFWFGFVMRSSPLPVSLPQVCHQLLYNDSDSEVLAAVVGWPDLSKSNVSDHQGMLLLCSATVCRSVAVLRFQSGSSGGQRWAGQNSPITKLFCHLMVLLLMLDHCIPILLHINLYINSRTWPWLQWFPFHWNKLCMDFFHRHLHQIWVLETMNRCCISTFHFHLALLHYWVILLFCHLSAGSSFVYCFSGTFYNGKPDSGFVSCFSGIQPNGSFPLKIWNWAIQPSSPKNETHHCQTLSPLHPLFLVLPVWLWWCNLWRQLRNPTFLLGMAISTYTQGSSKGLSHMGTHGHRFFPCGGGDGDEDSPTPKNITIYTCVCVCILLFY